MARIECDTIIVDDLDYTPLLRVPGLKAVRMTEARGMRPAHSELQQRLPWAAQPTRTEPLGARTLPPVTRTIDAVVKPWYRQFYLLRGEAPWASDQVSNVG